MAERLPTVGTPSLLRAINARTILERIQSSGPVSRAQVARDSGLSKPTVSLGLTALLEAGLVREVGRSSGRPGPSAVLYELNPAAGWVVGVDIGRRRVRAALADITGAVVGRRDEGARASSARSLIGQVGAIAHALAAEAGIGWEQVHQVTVGSPGVFEPVRGAVTLAPNLPGWGRQGLLAALREELGDRIGVENDVNLAAEGERWRGLGRGVRNFGFLSVGTGVGMGLVLDGRLYRGAGGAAGEVGYLPVGADPYDRQVRRRGAFEESVNAAAVVRRAAEAGMAGSLTAKKVFALARRGDPLARGVVEDEARRLALGLAVVTAVVDLELVILGGGVGGNADLLL
ncbi:MAG TPA: ROK family transcriptional regulator, partial [Actinomycetes bacterium]|nr:ROK family transcriptional regulator [Actinomycetes bacterium]